MIDHLKLSIRDAVISDRQRLANLMHFETYVHRHLDWRSPLDWLEHQPYLLLENDNKTLAALACPPDPPGVSWIRLFAVSSEFELNEAWELLWTMAQDQLKSWEVVTVAAIPLQDWLRKILTQYGFELSSNVAMLVWEESMPPERLIPAINIRPMNIDDLQPIERLDALSFGSLWHYSLTSLELAFRQAAVATVIEKDEKIVGYQISTGNQLGGHLARLAIHPDYQGHGIGYSLLRDVLEQFKRRGVNQVSVNTQQNNYASLSLYAKAGFRPTGETYPVYITHL